MIPSGGGRGGERKRTRRSEEDPNFPHIPEEIVFNLLSRLPGKSLSRFKCVSKRWRSLIALRQKEKLLVLSDDSRLHSVDRQGTVNPVAEPWERNLSPRRFIEILGSCDGLVLIRINHDLFLWNPATRYFEKVASHDALKDFSCCAASGLCYDSSTDEYKAVRALEGVWAQTVEIASLRSKCWTETEFRFPFAKCWLNPGPTVNGHLHWFASKKFANWRQGLASIVLEFNPQKNAFAKVPMPQPYGKKTIILGLGALQGCLCMARLDNQNQSNPQGNVELLVMKGFGVEKTWNAMFTIANSTGFNGEDELVPLYLMTNGEVLVRTYTRKDRERIKAYKANEVRDREIQILPNCIDAVQYEGSCIDVVQYEDSLVEPIGYNIRQEEELGGKVTYMEYINRICHQRSALVSCGYLEEFFDDEG